MDKRIKRRLKKSKRKISEKMEENVLDKASSEEALFKSCPNLC